MNIAIPHNDPHGCYINISTSHPSMPSNSPQGFLSTNLDIHEMSIWSLLRYGGIIPPLSPWSGISRLMPGYHYSGLICRTPVRLINNEPTCISGYTSKSDICKDMCNQIISRLDSVLLQYTQDRIPLVLFSGGVDSGLIAARLSRLGRKDTILVHYSFGPHDEETGVARKMAQLLGLQMVVVNNKLDFVTVLDSAGKIYPTPFGDHSTVPSLALALEVREYFSHRAHELVVLDGTGADGAFGMHRKIRRWRQLRKIPLGIFKPFLAKTYSRLWLRTDTAENTLRIMKRSATSNSLGFFVAQNTLDGILYPEQWTTDLDRLLTEWINGFVPGKVEQQIVAADLALTCSGIFAQKMLAPLKQSGLQVEYPFLSLPVTQFALDNLFLLSHDISKYYLKKALSQMIGSHLVFRKKSAFADPSRSFFSHPQFIERLCASTERGSFLSRYLYPEAVRSACEALYKGRRLPAQTENCLWLIVFTKAWYDSVTQ